MVDYYRKIERSVTISADKRSTVDLQVDVWSADANITKFILKLDTSDSTPIDLTDATVTTVLVYDGVILQDNGQVEEVATQRISYVLNERLRGYEGIVNGGFYVTLKTGQKIDIQNVSFNMRKSLIDTDLEPARENAYATFDTITNDVKDYANTQKGNIDGVVTDVKKTGNTAKTQIGQVLPSVQAKVSAINTELAKIDENMPDLFVAYADDSNGGGFSKGDSSKLYKGYGVKNSNLPTDYRWERNMDSLQVGGRNLLKDTANFGNSGMPSGAKDGWLNLSNATLESEKYNGLTVRSLKNAISRPLCDYYFTGFNLGDTYTLSFWAKGTIDSFSCYFYGDSGFVRAKVVNASIPYSSRTVFGDGMCAFTNPQITNWTRLSITWQLDSIGDINVAKKILIHTAGATSGDLYVCGLKLEKGNTATDWSPAPEDNNLNSNPINSILTTLSSENPSTTLGGTWVQLGTESKFNQTIYYWKRTN